MQPLRILVPFALSTLTIAQTGTFVSAGTGCPAPAPPGLGMTTAPSVGASNVVIAAGLPTDTALVFLVFGTIQSSVSLAGLGAPGCTQLVDGIFASPLMSLTVPTARFPIYVPNSAGFIGTAFDMQAAAVSPQSNLLGLAVSDRGTMTLGARSPFPVIAGLVLHLDAADPSGNSTLPADGSPLATWTDLSGRGNHASTGQASPIFRRNAVQGAPAVDFGVSAVDSLVTASSADFAAATATMFLVARNPVTALVSVAPPNTIDDEMLLYARPGRNVRAFHHTSPGHFTELPHQNSAFDTFIQEATFGINTVDVSNAIDGVGSTASLLTTGSPQPFPASVNRAVHVGRRGSSSFENGSGFIAEVIIYDRILSQQERDLVGSYLQAKFGLAAGYP